MACRALINKKKTSMTENPKTDAQASYLKTMCEQHGGEFDNGLTKAEASERMISCRGDVWRMRCLSLHNTSVTFYRARTEGQKAKRPRQAVGVHPTRRGRFGRCQISDLAFGRIPFNVNKFELL